MPRIIGKGDNLNELNANFAQQRLLEPVLLNSVPKCGTHLVRNIMRMFVPVDQQYHKAFIQLPNLREHQVAFSEVMPHLSWGHLLFSDEAAVVLHHVNHIVQIRDPYDWVLARARFYMSDSFQSGLEHLKGDNVTVEEVLNMMIFGIHGKAPPLIDIFTDNAVSWLATDAKVLRFENLLHHVKNIDNVEAETFFANLLKDCGMQELPEDWRERVRVGSDRKQSGTARENLAGGRGSELPDELPDMHKRLVNFAAPGLRDILGYE